MTIRMAPCMGTHPISVGLRSALPGCDFVRDLYCNFALTSLVLFYAIVEGIGSRFVDRRADISFPGERKPVGSKHMEKCRALSCKLATDLLVRVPRIVHITSKPNQHTESEMVIRENPGFVAVEVGALVGSKPVLTCSVIGTLAVFSRSGICRPTVSYAHTESYYDSGRCDDHCKRLDNDSNGFCSLYGHVVRLLSHRRQLSTALCEPDETDAC
ncbi:hypothetical protein BLIN101_01295 [Brevibacterium linens]|uniref:Uncharacterized protein n=1 Tax=Brevibacterium linens TaxID=1703 RepID=A0A2H1IKJ6_BRELN|nr:hypothetical protein BLIN101_01295 [Brevibacterium linens]